MAFGTFRQRPEIDFNRMNNIFGPPTREFQDVVPQEPPPVSDMFGPPSPQFQQATTQPGYQDPSMQPTGPQGPPGFTIPDVNMDFETPENQSLKRFMAMVAPQRGESSTRGKIGNVLMALGGVSPEIRDQTIHSKYHQAAGQYDREAGNLLKAAQIEGQQNQYAGLNAYRQGQLDLGAGRLGVAQTNAQTAQQRAKNAEILAGMPNVRVKPGKGGQPDIWYDSKSGKEIMRTPSGTIDPIQQYKMEQEGRMDVVEAQQEGATERANTAAVTDLTIAGMPARPTAPGQMSETQKSQLVENRAEALLRQDPTLSKYLAKNPHTGTWEIQPVVPKNSWGFGGNGLDPNISKQIADYLNNGTVPPQPGQQQAPAPGGQIPPQQPVPPGQGENNSVNQTPIGGNNPELSGVNTGYSGFGAAPRPGSTVQLTRQPGTLAPGELGSGQQPQVMTKTQTSKKTGAKRTVYSYDGGKTWVENAIQR